MNRIFTAIVAICLTLSAQALVVNHLQIGDLVFQKSQSQQSSAISEATHSPWTHVGIVIQRPGDPNWYVAESTATSVDVNPIDKFVNRGFNKEVEVRRFPHSIVDMSDPSNQRSLIDSIMSFAGRPYDSLFEWSDNSIYCSELVYKSYYKSFAVAPGSLQKIGDLDLTGPNIKKFVQVRERMKGSPVNLNEPIVTPVSVLNDVRLLVVQ